MITYDFNLTGKVAVITGGNGVLTSVFAEALAEHGAKVALVSRRLEAVLEAAAKLKAKGYTAYGYQANVLNAEELTKAHEDILRDFGTCDILVNGAGIHHPDATTSEPQFDPDTLTESSHTFFDLDLDKMHLVNQTDFMGTLIPTQIFSKDMLGKEGCSVINISSMNAFSPTTTVPIYSAAKAGINNFTQWLANYLALTGIRVNAIAPGFFVTSLNRKMMYHEDGTLTDRSERILAGTPMRRFGDPKECAGTLLYLVDPELSGFVTGAVIPVDGGFLAYCGV